MGSEGMFEFARRRVPDSQSRVGGGTDEVGRGETKETNKGSVTCQRMEAGSIEERPDADGAVHGA